MEESEKAAQLRAICTTDKSENSTLLGYPEVSVNRIFHASLHHDEVTPTCLDARKLYGSLCGREHVNREWRRPPAQVSQHVVQMKKREADQHSAWGSLPYTPLLHHAEIMESGAKGECSCWGCGPDQCGTVEAANRNTTSEDEYSFHPQSDVEEELELPLPLKADDELKNPNLFLLPHNYNFQCMMDARHFYSAEEEQCNIHPSNTFPPQSFPYSAPYLQNWNDPKNWLQHCASFTSGAAAQGAVSVNVPHFLVPPMEGFTQVSMRKLSLAAEKESVSTPQEKRRAISLPEECRNVFITYSLDVSLEMVSFVELLTKHGFRPAIDLFDNSIRRMDINNRSDSYLKDPSTVIIIAISPKYKKDIEGSVVDSHGLHTKYIHSLMQNEFIQQGSLNFRFVPVLFLGAIQKHVPSWLQNTRVYRWPQDTEDLLLRLLKEERYVPPSVPVELSLLIRPMTTSAASMASEDV